jgi:hypothetical protein
MLLNKTISKEKQAMSRKHCRRPFGKENKMAKKVIVLFSMACVVACCGAQSNQGENAPEISKEQDIGLPAKESTTYWVIRSQAMVELIPFLTKKRTEFKGHLKLLTDYLTSIGQAEAFLASGTEAPLSPRLYAEALGKTEEMKERHIPLSDKPLTWEQTVELAMKHVLREGYLPTDIEGEEELRMYKDICKQKEKYGNKVRKEVRQVAQKAMNIWLYLGKIDQQGRYKLFVYETKKLEREARAQRKERIREEARAKKQYEREQKELRRQDGQMYRQSRLRSEYDRYYW